MFVQTFRKHLDAVYKLTFRERLHEHSANI